MEPLDNIEISWESPLALTSYNSSNSYSSSYYYPYYRVRYETCDYNQECHDTLMCCWGSYNAKNVSYGSYSYGYQETCDYKNGC